MLYALLILMAVLVLLGHWLAPVGFGGDRPLISSHNVVLLLFVVYTLFPACLYFLNDGRFVSAKFYDRPEFVAFTLTLCDIALIAFLYGSVLGRRAGRKLVAAGANSISDSRTRHWSWILIAVGVLLKVYVIASTGGVDAAILRLSSSTQRASGLEDLNSFAIVVRTISGVADAGATWLLVDALRRRAALVVPTIAFATVLSITYLSIGKRLALILPLLAVSVAVVNYYRRVGIRWAPFAVVTALGAGLVSLLARVLGPAYKAGVTVNLNDIAYAQGSILRFYFYSLEYSTVEMITVAAQSRDEIVSLFGGKLQTFWITNIEPFAYTIPRVIWPGKPERFSDVSYAISTLLIGGRLDDASVGFACTLIGTSYVIAGLVGVVLVFGALGIVTARVDLRLKEQDWSVSEVMRYSMWLVIIFQFFRQGSLAWTFIVAVLLLSGYIGGVALIVILSKLPARVASRTQAGLCEAEPIRSSD